MSNNGLKSMVTIWCPEGSTGTKAGEPSGFRLIVTVPRSSTVDVALKRHVCGLCTIFSEDGSSLAVQLRGEARRNGGDISQ